MDLWLFAQRKCHSDIRYEKLTFRCRYSRSRLSERPPALQQLAVLTAYAAEGITGRQEEALLEYLWWIPERELTLKLFSEWFFRYLMHKWCNSDCYLSPSQRCLSLLSHTISSPLILTLNWSAKPCCSQQVAHSEWSFALFKGFLWCPVQFLTHIYTIWDIIANVKKAFSCFLSNWFIWLYTHFIFTNSSE